MGYDGLVTGAIARQLNGMLSGGRIERIYQPEKDGLMLHIHANKKGHRLYISANGNYPRMHLTKSESVNPKNPTAFCMLLRKHFQGGRITKINQVGSERIVILSIDHYDELGFSAGKQLIVEIMGKHSNITAIDAETLTIIDSIKRITSDKNRYRQLIPGIKYIAPPDRGKACLYTLTRNELDGFLSDADNSPPEILVDRIQGLSPSTAKEICCLAAIGTDKDVKHLTSHELYPTLMKISSAILNNADSMVYLNKDRTPADFHIFPQKLKSDFYEEIRLPGPNEAADYYYSNKADSNRIKQKSQNLCRSILGSLDKLYLKKQRLAEDLLKAKEAEIDRLYGELITAHLHEIPSGLTRVRLLNYYDDTLISIPLNPRFSPSENAQRYFKNYAKSKTALYEKNIQLKESDKSIDYLESVLTFAQNANSVQDIEELRNELHESGFPSGKKDKTKPLKIKHMPHAFKSDTGFRILVGRNNKDNDNLTFKTANKRDLWFHVKDSPGSHVILFTEGRHVSKADMLTAAGLAAYYSKARYSENVPVDVTEVRYVKKIPGGKPGMVTYTDNKTVFADPKRGEDITVLP